MDYNEQLGIKSIADHQKHKIGENLKLGWIFERWYEKVIVVILCLLGMWKLFEIII